MFCDTETHTQKMNVKLSKQYVPTNNMLENRTEYMMAEHAPKFSGGDSKTLRAQFCVEKNSLID